MTPDAQSARWHGFKNSQDLQRIAAERILAAARRAIDARNRFSIVLAGGETPRGVYRLLRTVDADWSRWHVYYGDERCLPADDVNRNSAMANASWLDHVPIPAGQVHAIPAELGAHAAALTYSQLLAGVGEFDLVLLGIGEDGHTASLFRDHDWGTAADAPDVLAVFAAPKPPPERVSLSAARLSRCRELMFLIAGASKRQAVQQWRSGEPIAASAIKPHAGVDVLIEQNLLG